MVYVSAAAPVSCRKRPSSLKGDGGMGVENGKLAFRIGVSQP
jgi:hypothetical protein